MKYPIIEKILANSANGVLILLEEAINASKGEGYTESIKDAVLGSEGELIITLNTPSGETEVWQIHPNDIKKIEG